MDTPDPRFPDVPTDEIGDTVLLPAYLVELAELMQTTEGHADPVVRATRKIVVQASIALGQALAAIPRTCRDCGCTDLEACFPTCSWVGPNLCSACAQETSRPDTTGRATSSAVLLMQEHQVTASQIREWCREHDIEVSARGAIAIDVVRLYVDNHSGAAA